MMSQSPLGSQPMSDFLCLAFLYALALKHMQAGISLWFWTFILQMIAALTCSYSQPEAEATFLFIARHHASVVCNSSCLFSWKKKKESESLLPVPRFIIHEQILRWELGRCVHWPTHGLKTMLHVNATLYRETLRKQSLMCIFWAILSGY